MTSKEKQERTDTGAATLIGIVGNPDPVHVGAHFASACETLAIPFILFDIGQASSSNYLTRKLCWALGRRPDRLDTFSGSVVEACQKKNPSALVTTGASPLNARDLRKIGDKKVIRINFSTDDPWNPAQRSNWFLDSLCEYDYVFSPRRANLEQLKKHGCRNVSYLPFAYAPAIHFREPASTQTEAPPVDVVFVGGADEDRIPYVRALIESHLTVELYGGYWDRSTLAKPHWRGFASPVALRQLSQRARVSLCLVRRANRDGHCMRTFELAAMGACILAERTNEHLEIYGSEGESVLYFETKQEMIDKVRWLLSAAPERNQLRERCNVRITTGGNRYEDRLRFILETAKL